MKHFILIFIISFSLSAQVKGVVKDSISGKPIEYVGIFTSQVENNFSSDKKGKFKTENLTKNDTLWFFTTGYKEKKIAFKDITKTIYLVPISNSAKNKNLDDYTQKKQWIDLQTNNTSTFQSTASTFSNLNAYFVEGINSSNKSIILDKLSFMTLNLAQKTTIFKVRFFSTDSLKNVGKEILDKPIFIEVNTLEKRVNNNVYHIKTVSEIEVLNEKIEIPKEGFYIAIETLNINRNQYKNKTSDLNITLISPSLTITDIETKVYSYCKGEWIKIEKANYFPDFKISIATTQN